MEHLTEQGVIEVNILPWAFGSLTVVWQQKARAPIPCQFVLLHTPKGGGEQCHCSVKYVIHVKRYTLDVKGYKWTAAGKNVRRCNERAADTVWTIDVSIFQTTRTRKLLSQHLSPLLQHLPPIDPRTAPTRLYIDIINVIYHICPGCAKARLLLLLFFEQYGS